MSDNKLVIKIKTFKSGEFIFTNNFSMEELSNNLIEAKILYRTVNDLPILPKFASYIEEDLIKRSIFGTAAIEGNPLNEKEVAQIVSQPEEMDNLKQAGKEIQNLKSVYDFVNSLKKPETPFKLTESNIKKIQKTITQNIDYEENVPGNYRNHPVLVGDKAHGGIYKPPRILADIRNLMNAYTMWINHKEITLLDPIIRAALAHYYLSLIHPFSDGNGRTARVIEAMLLRLSGIKYVPVMLSNFYYRNIDDYFKAFSNSIKNKDNDVTPFLSFVIQGFVDSLNEIKDRITSSIRKLTLKDYYNYLRTEKHISQRQYDLLILLLDNLRNFTLIDLIKISPFTVLYRNVSERTARRDLNKLSTAKLLVTENSKYYLNLRVLE